LISSWAWEWRIAKAFSSKHAIAKRLNSKGRFHAAARVAQVLCTLSGRGTIAVRRAPDISEDRMNSKFMDDLSARLAEMASANPARDLQKNFRGMLSSAFSRLDLVTREEYEVQAEVLARAREKLTALEARVAELEAQAAARR
jgi:hypothetical protein